MRPTRIIEMLEPDIREKLISNLRRVTVNLSGFNDFLLSNDYSGVSELLNHSFCWDDSPEGDAYWRRIYIEWSGINAQDYKTKPYNKD